MEDPNTALPQWKGTVVMSKNLWLRLRRYALDNDTSASRVIRELLAEFLNSKETEKE